LVVQNEAVGVFDHMDPDAQFDRHAGLALADPFGMGLENGEDLLFVGDGFSLQAAAMNLIDQESNVAWAATWWSRNRCNSCSDRSRWSSARVR